MKKLGQIIYNIQPPKYRIEYLYECDACGATGTVKADEHNAVVRCPFCTWSLMNRVDSKKVKLTKAERIQKMKEMESTRTFILPASPTRDSNIKNKEE